MTVSVTQKMRKRIDAINGKTIYRRTAYPPSIQKGSEEFYDEVSGVKLDKIPEQLKLKFDNKETQRIKKIEDVLDKLNVIEAQIREVRGAVIDLE